MYFFTRSPWLTALGSSLVNSLWQMALVWLAYIFITGINKRFSAAARHALAIVSLCVGSGWFIIGLLRALGHPGDTSTGLASILLSSGTNLTKIFYTGRKWLDAALPFFSFAWLGAVFFMLVQHALYYRRLQAMRNQGLQRIQPRLKLFTATTAAHMGIRKKVMVWLSEIVDTPVTIGFFKPIILIPIAMINHLTPDQVEAILLHELSHIRRNDYLINLFITWAGIVFFFNPFSRLLIRIVRREREHCCDDLVLQYQYNPQDYALALLSLEKKRQQTISLALAAVGKSQPLLLERVKRLTGQPETVRRYSITMVLFLLFSMLLAVGMMVKEKHQPGLPVLASKPAKDLVPEVFTVKYVTGPPSSQKKSIKIVRKNKKTDFVVDQTTDEESSVIFAGNSELEDQAEPAPSPAVHSQNWDYSMITSVDPAVAPATTDLSLPYVPTTSYFYQVQDDTLPQSRTMEREEARTSRERSLSVMKQLDWTKIEKKFAKNKKLAVVDLQNQIQLSLRNFDQQTIHEQVNPLLSEADQKRLRESIDLQMEVYNIEKNKNPQRAHILQKKIREGQLRLKEDYLKKQLESVQKAQEQLRKVAKVVYI